jgi:translocation and assembly module TamB
MKRRVLLIIISVLILIVLLFSGLSVWLMGTAEGARWLILTVSKFTSIQISADSIQGRLWDDLRLEKVTVRWPEGDAGADMISFRWRPFYLLNGNAGFKKILLDNLYINDRSPEEKTDLTWPKIKGIPARINGWIDAIEVSGLSYRSGVEPPVQFKKISSTVLWNAGKLTFKDLLIDADSFDVSGTVAAGFDKPFLYLDIKILPDQPLNAMDSFAVKAHLPAGDSPVQVQGPVGILGFRGAEEQMSFSSDIKLAQYALIAENILLKETGRKGSLSGRGEIDFSSGEPAFRTSVEIAELDLSPELRLQTNIAGKLGIEGTTENYEGTFRISNSGEAWRSGELSGSLKGDRGGVRFLVKEGAWLRGALKGRVESSWEEGLSLSADMQARKLNPAAVTPEWHGTINFDISGRIAWPEDGKPEGEVNGKILNSTLRGRPLRGEVSAMLSADDLIVRRLLLQGNGFDISAKGDIRNRLTFLADITDLSGLIPESRGRINADGWFSIKDRFRGAATAAGYGIAIDDLSIGTASLRADFFTSEKQPLNINAEVKKVGYKTALIDSARIDVRGSAEQHDIVFSADFHKTGLMAKMTGAYKAESWDGKITEISGHDSAGAWRLETPAKIHVSTGKILVPGLVLTGSEDERFNLKADIGMKPLNGFIYSDWTRIDLKRANQLLRDVYLSGHTSGKLRATWAAGRLTEISADSISSGKVTADQQTADIQEVLLRADWNAKGLLASFRGRLSEGGKFEGGFTSSVPVGLALPEQGKMNGTWQEVNLMILNPLMPDNARISGKMSGRMDTEWAGGDLLRISGMVDASGALIIDGQRIETKRTHLKMDWDSKGLGVKADLELLRQQGTLKAEIISSVAARAGLPDSGEIDIRLNKIDASVVRPWLPEGMDLQGIVSAQIKGRFLPEQRLDISGNSRISAGTARYVTEKGEISAELRTAGVSFIWREEALRGNLEIALADYGDIRGDFSLPVPARIPVSIIKDRGIRLSLKGKAEEKGLLSSFFPGLIQKSRGRLEIDIGLSGTWDKPLYAGRAELTDAGAYLPSSGISIRDVRANARFDKNSIIIESLSAKSGKGSIKASAELKMEKFRLTEYTGDIEGEDFQAVYLPELQVVVSPDLTFQGKPGSVSVRGEIKVPELFVTESERELVKPSDDVIIVDEEKKPERRPETALDISVNVVFGKRVFIKMEGIDARLEGEVRVTAKGLDAITGNGVIKVVKGAYRKYGIDLDIKRGQAIFADGPISDPTLDILAVREADDVKAGIIVSGTAMSPVVNLYSDPPMTDTDILSYIVLGHSAGADQAQIGLLSRAAGLLLSRGESATLQAKLQKGLGVDVLDIQAGSGEVARSALTVGKYLSPRLFISYGLSLFTGENVFRARYKLSRRWEIQTESGFDTGIDLFYKIEFR